MGCCGYTIGALVNGCLGLAVYMVAFGAPYWFRLTQAGGEAYSGLWLSCVKIGGSTTCTSLTPSNLDSLGNSWLIAVQVMACLALVSALAALALNIFCACKKEKTKVLCLASCGLYIFAGLADITCVIIYSVKVDDNRGFAFGMCAGSISNILVAGILSGVAAFRKPTCSTDVTKS